VIATLSKYLSALNITKKSTLSTWKNIFNLTPYFESLIIGIPQKWGFEKAAQQNQELR